MSYPQAKWGDLVTLEYGKALRDYKDNISGIPVFGSSGVVGYTEQPLAPGPGVIVARKGTLGCHYSRIPFFVIDTGFYIRPKAGTDIDLRWVYFALKARDFTSLDTGAAIPSLTREHFYSLEVSLPSLEQQQRIAAMLGSYDDLIEVNRRRMSVLEEMAQGLFDEWFVRFRFPGHEDVPIVDTPDGPLPKGWKVKDLGELLRLNYGKALKADRRVPGAVAVIGSSGVVGSHANRLVKGPGIVVGRKGNVGSVIWSAIDFWPIDTAYFVETALPLMYVYELLRRVPFQNTDAAVPGLNRDYALSRKVTVPSLDLIERYGRFAQPVRDQIDALETANERLAASRDLLLPRLISGHLSVEAAERELEEVA